MFQYLSNKLIFFRFVFFVLEAQQIGYMSFKCKFRLKHFKICFLWITMISIIIWLYYVHRYHYNIVGGLYMSFVESHVENYHDKDDNNIYPTVLIGIGVMKSGTTFFLDALSFIMSVLKV